VGRDMKWKKLTHFVISTQHTPFYVFSFFFALSFSRTQTNKKKKLRSTLQMMYIGLAITQTFIIFYYIKKLLILYIKINTILQVYYSLRSSL
jgi:hypothetical protein